MHGILFKESLVNCHQSFRNRDGKTLCYGLEGNIQPLMLYGNGEQWDRIGTPLLQKTKRCKHDIEGLNDIGSVHTRGYGVESEELGPVRLGVQALFKPIVPTPAFTTSKKEPTPSMLR